MHLSWAPHQSAAFSPLLFLFHYNVQNLYLFLLGGIGKSMSIPFSWK
jgi:hypothetical protein